MVWVKSLYGVWFLLATYLAFQDYKTQLLALWQLIVFALLSAGLLYLAPQIYIYDAMFNMFLVFFIFGVGKITKSMVIGGADWIYFPAVLAVTPQLVATISFMTSLILMSVITSIVVKKNSKKFTPFITILWVCTLFVWSVSYEFL